MNQNLADTLDRRQEILAAAAEVFDEAGFAEATMDAVAARAGVSKGSLYNYFRNKQDLFVHVMRQSCAQDLEQASRSLQAEPTAAARMEYLLDTWYGMLGRYKRIGRLMLEFWAIAAREDPGGKLTTAFQEVFDQWRGLIAEVVEDGRRRGEFRKEVDPMGAASMTIALSDGLLLHGIIDAGVEISESFHASVKSQVLMALRVGSSPPGSPEKGLSK